MNFIYARISKKPEGLMSLRKKNKEGKSSYINKINLFYKYIKIYLFVKNLKYIVMSERRLLSGVFRKTR